VIHRRDLWVPAAIVALTAAVAAGCGAATYNEGDNDDQPPTNPCAETQATRPVNCEDDG